MPYLIDGHNLIPKIPGMDLGAVDDENQLIELLQEFCRQSRKQVEVIYDNAPAGQPRVRTYGLVLARFARTGQTADELIRHHLQRQAGAARNWTVVSSDHQVQGWARAVRAQVLSSEDFALLLMQTLQQSQLTPRPEGEEGMSSDEIDDWLTLFGDESGEE
jgi:hypothetical protein